MGDSSNSTPKVQNANPTSSVSKSYRKLLFRVNKILKNPTPRVPPPPTPTENRPVIAETSVSKSDNDKRVVKEESAVCSNSMEVVASESIRKTYAKPTRGNDEELKVDYISYESHTYSEEWQQDNKPDCSKSDYYCTLCDSHMNSEYMWEAHICGKRHLKNLKKKPNGGIIRKKSLKVEGNRSSIQQILDSVNEPVVGLNFITELQKWGSDPLYSCYLCKSTSTISVIVDHIMSLKHRQQYLKHVDPETSSLLESMDVSKAVLNDLVMDKAQEWEDKNGRGRMEVKQAIEKMDVPSPKKRFEENTDESNEDYEMEEVVPYSQNKRFCSRDRPFRNRPYYTDVHAPQNNCLLPNPMKPPLLPVQPHLLPAGPSQRPNHMLPPGSSQQQNHMHPTGPTQQQNHRTPAGPTQQQNHMHPTGPIQQQNHMVPAGPTQQQNHMLPTGPTQQQNHMLPAGPTQQQNHILPAGSTQQQNHMLPAGPTQQQNHMLPAGPTQQPHRLPVRPTQQPHMLSSGPSQSPYSSSGNILEDVKHVSQGVKIQLLRELCNVQITCDSEETDVNNVVNVLTQCLMQYKIRKLPPDFQRRLAQDILSETRGNTLNALLSAPDADGARNPNFPNPLMAAPPGNESGIRESYQYQTTTKECAYGSDIAAYGPDITACNGRAAAATTAAAGSQNYLLPQVPPQSAVSQHQAQETDDLPPMQGLRWPPLPR